MTATPTDNSVLTDRWTPLRYHPVQRAYWLSRRRFNVVRAGRRSGKTELAKRKAVRRAMAFGGAGGGRFAFCAPTRQQAKKIYWQDLKLLVPGDLMLCPPREGELIVRFVTGTEIHVLGLDRPERVEGQPWDGLVVDEVANTKRGTWARHLRPALSTPDRLGWCDFIGVPEPGGDEFNDLAEMAQDPSMEDWSYFHWPSADILPAEEIEAARRELDPLSFQLEYEAKVVSYSGRAYYTFERGVHAVEKLPYEQRADLVLCFDFNVSPGVACVCQEQRYAGANEAVVKGGHTAVIGEVWIPYGSNTQMVCRKLAADWGGHEGNVLLYGDATGGAKKTSQTSGTDWDIIRQELRPVFGDRLKVRVGRSNPLQRVRVNAMNARLRNAAGEVRLLIDPSKAPHVVKDLEQVTVLEGTAGEIDKDRNPELTHISDALGYYVSERFPLRAGATTGTRDF